MPFIDEHFVHIFTHRVIILVHLTLCRVFFRDRAGGDQPVRAAADLWRGGDQRVQRAEHGRHGPSHIRCG